MSTEPEQIRADIERTRAALSDDVNALAGEANPKNIAKRQVNKVKEAGVNVKDRIMGTAGDASDAVDDLVSSAGDTLSDAPDRLRAKTEGNPLAAGLIAFGAGLLISSLFPASQKEQAAAVALKDRLEPVREQVVEMAKDAASNLKQPAEEALEAVKTTASDSVDAVKAQGEASVAEVQQQTDESRRNVQSVATSTS